MDSYLVYEDKSRCPSHFPWGRILTTPVGGTLLGACEARLAEVWVVGGVASEGHILVLL